MCEDGIQLDNGKTVSYQHCGLNADDAYEVSQTTRTEYVLTKSLDQTYFYQWVQGTNANNPSGGGYMRNVAKLFDVALDNTQASKSPFENNLALKGFMDASDVPFHKLLNYAWDDPDTVQIILKMIVPYAAAESFQKTMLDVLSNVPQGLDRVVVERLEHFEKIARKARQNTSINLKSQLDYIQVIKDFVDDLDAKIGLTAGSVLIKE